VADRPGLLLDTSLAALVDLVALPPARLVFGSDRPYGEHGTALRLVARAAEIAGWDRGQLGGVLGGNLRRLLDGQGA
jgi:predicted TIM-barrel fold metal-dependent hydrolase